MLISRAVVVIKRVAAHNRDQRANMQNTNLFATRDELVFTLFIVLSYVAMALRATSRCLAQC